MLRSVDRESQGPDLFKFREQLPSGLDGVGSEGGEFDPLERIREFVVWQKREHRFSRSTAMGRRMTTKVNHVLERVKRRQLLNDHAPRLSENAELGRLTGVLQNVSHGGKTRLDETASAGMGLPEQEDLLGDMDSAGGGMPADVAEVFEGLHQAMDCSLGKLEKGRELSLEGAVRARGKRFKQSESSLKGRGMGS